MSLLSKQATAPRSCSFLVLGFTGQDRENKTEMKPAVRGLRGLKVRMKCLRVVIEAPLKFEQ